MVSAALIDAVQHATKQSSIQGLPDRLSSFFQPVVECNPALVSNGHSITAMLSNSTSTNLFASPADKDVYITAASIADMRDATATYTATSIVCTNYEGASVVLLQLPGLTLTAGQNTNQIVFNNPIRIQRGSTVTLTTTAATANFRVAGQISYYLDENPKDG